MLATSEEILSAWLSPARQLAVRVKVDQSSYGSEDVTSLSFDSGSISGEVYQIGSTYMNTVQIVFPSIIETIKEDQEVIPELGILVGGEYHYSKLGHFFITEFNRDRNAKTTTITASDKMIYMEGVYESKLTYSKPYREVALEIANLAGVEINQASFASLGTLAIRKPVGYTYRQAIGLIAQFEGGFASFNRDGELEIRRLRPTDFEVTPESYLLKGFSKNENAYRIGGITVRIGEEETDVLRVGSTNGSQVELENKVMTQTLLNNIWDLVKNLNYFPFELKWRGCPLLEAGDWMYVADRDGKRYSVPNLSYSLNFNGGLSGDSKATTNSSSQATYKYRGSLKQRVDWLDSILSANNWNSNYYDATEPPNPKEGDIWFKPNGQDTEIWIYEKDAEGNLSWVLQVSTATDPELIEAIEEVGEKVEQAQSDAEKALTDANDAVDKANQAAAKADASGQAAQLAIEQSANALSEAEEAKTDATDALTNAKQAQDDAAKALDDITNLDTVNLLPNSTWNSGQGTWTVGFTGRYEILQPEEDKPNSNILHGLPLTTNTQQLSNMPHPIYVKAGQHYALAFDFKELNFSSSKSILFLRIFNEKTTPNTSADALWSQSLKHATFGITSNVTQWRRLTYTFVAPSTGWLDVIPYDSDESGIHETFYREIMLVKSSVVPKSWTPYPGDVKIQIDNINGELSQKVSQSTFDVLNQTVVNQATQINQNATDIALKANQSTVDNLAGRVTDAETAIDLNAKEIKLKASQKVVDTIAGRVDSAEASLVTMAGEIKLKASQTSVDTLNDTVESVQSELKVEAGKISALNTLTDGHTTQIGSLQTGYDGLSSTVALVQNRFTDGNNLATDGDFESGLNRGIELYQTLESYPKPSGNYAARLYVNGAAGSEYTQQWTLPTPITLLANTEYTIEYDYSVAGTARGTASDYARDENGNWISGIMMEKSQHVLTGGQTVWKKYVNTFKLNQETVLSRLRFGFVLNGDGVGWKTIDNIKIYQGSSIVTQFSNLTQEIDTIQATVASNEANTQAQLIMLSDQIISTVGQLRDGNNLVDDGNFESGNGRGLSLIGQTDTYPKPSGNFMARLMKTGGTVSEDYYQIWTLPTPVTLLANTEYTIEYDYSVAGTARGNASDYLRTSTGSWVSGVMMDHESHSLVGGQGVWKKYTKTFSLSAETTISAMRFGFVLNGTGTGWKVIDNIKIYQGASTQSQITQLADRMNFRIINSDGSITQIDLANKVISLSGEQVNITGNTFIENGVIKTAAIADAAITNAKIGNISASKVTTGELNAANVNIINLNASNIVSGELTGITIKSAANGSLFQVRGNDLYMQKANGDNLTMSTSGIYWYDSAGEILFQSSKKLTTSDIFGTAEYNAYLAAFNETRSVTYASALKGQGGVNDYTYVAHRASKIFANQMEINTGNGNPTHLYLKTSSADADVRVAVAGDGDISYARLRAGGLFGNFVSINTQTNAVQLYLQTADEVRVKNTGNDAAGASYKAVRASAFNTSSLAEYKTNIKPFDQSALDLIKASTVYEYNLKSDLATQEIGLVIGDGYDIADIVVNGDGVSQYRMGSLAWKAIQELNQKIETLEQEIRVLQAA